MCPNSMKLEEVNLNFAHKCNMNCPFCYVPFRAPPVLKKTLEEVVAKICEFSPKRVIIAGGDPLSYTGIVQATKFFRKHGIAIHIDTNLKSFPVKRVEILSEMGVSFGVPIESSVAELHDQMRAELGHFSKILEKIKTLLSLGANLKVNTVVSNENYKGIHSMANMLNELGIRKWSLYQFWPMEAGFENSEQFEISESAYLSVTEICRDLFKGEIGGGLVSERRDGYFFVRHDGSVYSVDKVNVSEYVELGSIFSDNILQKWEMNLSKQCFDPSVYIA